MPHGVLVIGVAAAAVGFGAASVMAAVRGEYLVGTWGTGRHRGAAVLVALTYLAMGAFLLWAITDAAR